MSLGGLIGAVVGGIGGFLIGGPAGAYIGAGVGMGIGMIIDPMSADAPSGTQTGDLEVTGAKRGTVLKELEGAGKITGTIVWYAGNRSEEVKAESSGGKK